jgi:hypothetical protein
MGTDCQPTNATGSRHHWHLSKMLIGLAVLYSTTGWLSSGLVLRHSSAPQLPQHHFLLLVCWDYWSIQRKWAYKFPYWLVVTFLHDLLMNFLLKRITGELIVLPCCVTFCWPEERLPWCQQVLETPQVDLKHAYGERVCGWTVFWSMRKQFLDSSRHNT